MVHVSMRYESQHETAQVRFTKEGEEQQVTSSSTTSMDETLVSQVPEAASR